MEAWDHSEELPSTLWPAMRVSCSKKESRSLTYTASQIVQWLAHKVHTQTRRPLFNMNDFVCGSGSSALQNTLTEHICGMRQCELPLLAVAGGATKLWQRELLATVDIFAEQRLQSWGMTGSAWSWHSNDCMHALAGAVQLCGAPASPVKLALAMFEEPGFPTMKSCCKLDNGRRGIQKQVGPEMKLYSSCMG